MSWRGVAQALQTVLPRKRVKLWWRSWNGNEIAVGYCYAQRVTHKHVAFIRLLKHPRVVMARMAWSFNGVKFKTDRGNFLAI